MTGTSPMLIGPPGTYQPDTGPAQVASQNRCMCHARIKPDVQGIRHFSYCSASAPNSAAGSRLPTRASMPRCSTALATAPIRVFQVERPSFTVNKEGTGTPKFAAGNYLPVRALPDHGFNPVLSPGRHPPYLLDCSHCVIFQMVLSILMNHCGVAR